jgi:hypothetical protein
VKTSVVLNQAWIVFSSWAGDFYVGLLGRPRARTAHSADGWNPGREAISPVTKRLLVEDDGVDAGVIAGLLVGQGDGLLQNFHLRSEFSVLRFEGF